MREALILHPDCRCAAAREIVAEATRTSSGGLAVHYVLRGAIDDILWPPPRDPGRADDLWRTTCFEAFVRGRGDAYEEFNFSPSRQWAAYGFDGYRTGMHPREMATPRVDVEFNQGRFELRAEIASLPRPLWLGLSAVIEEANGVKSYWALAHPAGAPDFHHPVGFVLELP